MSRCPVTKLTTGPLAGADEPDLTAACDALSARWVLRLLNRPGSANRLIRHDRCDFVELARRLGFEPQGEDSEKNDAAWRPTMDQLRALHQQAERASAVLPEPIASNVKHLGDLIGLNETERAIVAFTAILNADAWLGEFMDALGPVSVAQLHQALVVLLDTDVNRIYEAFMPAGPLRDSGLVSLRVFDGFGLRDKLSLMIGLADFLFVPQQDPSAVLAAFFELSAQAQLTLADFPHVDRDLEVILPYLKSVLARREPGVNILIHGQSGVGKTELTRTLAAELGASLYEISNADDDSSPKNGLRRLEACQLSQKVLTRHGRCMVLFDEIEDVFPSPFTFFTEGNTQTGRKAWINRLLERNPVPAFWLSNRISHIDTAFLRRFTYVLKLRLPPRARRAEFIRECMGKLPVSAPTVERLADCEHLTPAVTAQAAGVARALAGCEAKTVERAFARTIENALTAMSVSSTGTADSSPMSYDLDLVNADHDLTEIIEGLRRTASGRLCLYGPPGTGKTCYARHIARSLDQPLHARSGSDILSAWVGGTEKNIRAMFRDASDEGAILLLDEADSFFQDRRCARRSWEITQVNELLVQMEQFQGVFIASTNLVETLDWAASRRFDAKVFFGYLTTAQARTMFDRTLERLASGRRVPAEVWHRLAKLDSLTPGDFAALYRKATLCLPSPTPRLVMDALEQEYAMKPDRQGRASDLLRSSLTLF